MTERGRSVCAHLIAAAWVVFVAFCVLASVRSSSGDEVVGFTASPRVALWQFQPVEVLVRFFVSKPDDLNCADYGFDWNDGSTSALQADCDPYDPPERWSESRKHLYKSPGIYIITLTFFRTYPDGKVKILRRFQTEVEIR